MNRRELFKLGGKVGLVALAAQVPWTWLERAGLVDEYIAEAAALPQNYIESAGTVLGATNGGLASLLSYNGSGTGAVWAFADDATSSTLHPTGIATNMLRGTCTDAGSSTPGAEFNWTISLVPNTINSISVPVYVDYVGSVSQPALVQIFLAQESGFVNWWNYSDTAVFPRYWHEVRLGRANAVAQGSPNPATTCIRLRVRVQFVAGCTGSVLVGPVMINRRQRPTVSLSFDDGYDTVQTIYEHTNPRKLPMSIAINGSTIGTAGKLSLAQVQTMQTNGVSVHDHTWDHSNGSNGTASELRTSIELNRAYMIANGLTSGIDSFVVPFGSIAYNDGWASILPSYYRYAWTAEGSFYGMNTLDGIVTPLRIERCGVGNGSVNMTTRINSAIAAGKSIHFMGHNDTLASMLDAINLITRLRDSNVIQVRNLADFIKGYTNPRRLRTAL